jgi:hypothetical protein
MNYPYPRLFLDIQFAKKRIESLVGFASDLTDGISDRPRSFEPCPHEPLYARTTQERAKPICRGEAIEQTQPSVGRSIVGRANPSAAAEQISMLKNCRCGRHGIYLAVIGPDEPAATAIRLGSLLHRSRI